MEQAPKSRIVFLSRLIGAYLDADEERTLVVNDLTIATLIREKLAYMLNDFDDPQVLVLDLAGVGIYAFVLAGNDSSFSTANPRRRAWQSSSRRMHH